MARKIRIQGKTYKVPNLDDLSLDDILILDMELQDRYHSSWVKVQEFVEDVGTLTEAEAAKHPMSTLMAGVTVWMVLRVAGQDVSMKEACSISPSQIEEVDDGPKDHQPKKGSKSRARKGSAVGTAGITPSVSSAPSEPLSTSSPQTSSTTSSASA